MKNTHLLISTLLILLFACKNKDILPDSGPYFSIPDKNFEQYLVESKIDKDGIVNGSMAKEDAKGIKEITCSSRAIKSLKGIEYFVDLLDLVCYENQISSLDLSKNVNLTRLHCVENQLMSLNLSKNVNLRKCYCGKNQLMNLDVSKNLNLTVLWCYNNRLKGLDLKKNLNLMDLECDFNQIASLEVDRNESLETLWCFNNQIESLDLSKNKNLAYLYCYSNPIKTICVSDIEKAKANKNWDKDATAEYKVCN